MLRQFPIFRQISNLTKYGRFRTCGKTVRAGKPRILREEPSLEIGNFLEFAVAGCGQADRDFVFVQIGAFDGRTDDPLHELVTKHHWRGVLVEPQPQAFEQLKRNYSGEKQLQFFNVAIGPNDGQMTIYTRKSGDVTVASVAKHLLVKPGRAQNDIAELEVPCWTLSTLLENANMSDPIDLLQIDTEGFDYEIIRSINFERVKPLIIRFEHAILSEQDRNACLRLLAEQGYSFVLEDMDTTALLGREHQADVA